MSVINKGSKRGIKRYFCTECKVSFSSKRRSKNLQAIIFNKYVYKRHILRDLAQVYHRSIPWNRKQIFEYESNYKTYFPRAVNLISDATFYGKRKDKLGTLVSKTV